MEFLVGTHINFLGHRKGAFILSLVVIAIGLVSLGIQGGPKLGIDFEGGILLQVQFEQPIAAESIRATLAEIGLGDAEIQHFGSGREAIIRTRDQGGEDLTGAIVTALNEANPDNQADVRRQELVGPKVGGELRKKATLAILYALFGILIYISLRFEFKFAVGAVAALVHDVLIVLGMFRCPLLPGSSQSSATR